MIRSPNQYHDNEFHSTRGAVVSNIEVTSSSSDIRLQSLSIDEATRHAGSSSPFARANRQARVVETNDSVTTDIVDINFEESNSISTPRRRQQNTTSAIMTSPPPKLPLPSVPPLPTTPIRKDFGGDIIGSATNNSNNNNGTKADELNQTKSSETKENTPQGLGLDINYYEESRDYINSYLSPKQKAAILPNGIINVPTPAVTNLEEINQPQQEQQYQQSHNIGRKTSILRTPKLGSLKHKRSTSGGSASKFGGLFKKDEPLVINNIVQVATPKGGHARHASDSSVNGSAFSTPPLPFTSPAQHTSRFSGGPGFNRDHFRSTSDTGVVESLNEDLTPFARSDLEMRAIKLEIYQLDSQKQLLNGEVKRLSHEKGKLQHLVKDLKDKIGNETTAYDQLLKSIDELKFEKSKLLELNQALSSENHRLEIKKRDAYAAKQSSHDTSDHSSTNTSNGTIGGSTLANIPSQTSASGGLLAGAPYTDEPIDENPETHKATKLKFWRRPKLGFTAVGGQQPIHGTLNSNSNTNTQMSHSSSAGSNTYSNNNNGNLNNQNQYTPANNIGPSNNNNNNGNGSNPSNGTNGSYKSTPHQTYGNSANVNANMNNNSNQVGNSMSNNSNSTISVNGNNTNNNNNNNSSNNNNNGVEHLTTGPEKKGLGGFITKSRSTNILDTFLSGASQQSIPEPDPFPLLTTTLQQRANYENVNFPIIISKCLEEVERRGLDMEGVYRISGGNSAIIAIENAFSVLPPNCQEDDKLMIKLEETMSGDINAVTSALKRYLRKLPDPIIPYALYDDFIKVSLTNSPNKTDKRMKDLKTVIQKLPSANKHALHALCKHLNLVNSYSSVNRMGFKNLSVVFAPTLARDETGQKEMIDMGYRNDVTDLMLSNYDKVF